jgi:hypothetical protein
VITYEILDARQESLPLSESYRVRSVVGVGVPAIKNLSTSGPQQHGATWNGFRLEPRVITLSVAIVAPDHEALFAMKDRLIHAVCGFDSGFHIQATLPNGDKRRLACRLSSGVDMDISWENGQRYQPAVLQAVAYNPLWFDPNGGSYVFGLSISDNALLVPTVIPLFIGASELSQVDTIEYAGNFREYPVITVTGPVTDLVITNQTTGEKLDFTGVTIAGGDTYTIDLRYESKTLVDQDGVNKISELTSDSDFATFHLASTLEVADGRNTISAVGSTVTGETAIAFSWKNRYLAI